MELSQAVLKEVGTTNKTRIEDYKKAINAKSSILCKVHKSNYAIKGFTQEASIQEIIQLGREAEVLTLYDLGSGLVDNFGHECLKGEPTIREALAWGVDLVCFSADKLFGACQAGIIAGKSRHIEKLRKSHLYRALRVDKTTLAILEAASRYYLKEERLSAHNVLFQTVGRSITEMERLAQDVSEGLISKGIDNRVVRSTGQIGGGALPDKTIESFAVVLHLNNRYKVKEFAKEMQLELLKAKRPLVTNLNRGEVHIDMLCIQSNQKEGVIDAVSESYEALHHRYGGAH
jgi:L-seryl-tRNA(Ser) seleniumtransferase